MPSEVYVGRTRSVVTHTVLSFLTFGLYFFVWYAKIIHELRRHRGRGPHWVALLLLFLFVATLGQFLATLLAAIQLRKVQRAVDADKTTSALIPALWAILPIVGWIIAAGILQSGSNRAWMRLHGDLEHATQTPVTLECPQCAGRFDQFLHPFAANPVQCPHCGRAADL